MQNKKVFKIIVFLVVLLIPVIYSFFYLKSYWNPYGNLKDMKIAIVNLDEGVEGVNQGKELADQLIKKDVMDFEMKSKNEAEEGLKNNEYYAVITIPSNFTECVRSAASNEKKVASITYTPNQQKNYLASQIINKVVTATESSLEAKVSKEVVASLSDTLSDVPDSLQKISDGADQISEGSKSLNSGLKELSEGIGLLNDKYTEFDNGIESAYTGSKELSNGIKKINDGTDDLAAGAMELDDAIVAISNGSNNLKTQRSAGISNLVDSFSLLSAGAKQVSNGASNVATSLNSKLSASEASILQQVGVQNAEQLAQKISLVEQAMGAYGSNAVDSTTGLTYAKLYQKLCQAQGALSALEGAKTSITESANDSTSQTSLYALAAGAKQVSDGAAKLASDETVNSLQTLAGGISELDSALSQVKAGTGSLKTGVSTLKAGTSQIQSGSETLTSGLKKLDDSSAVVKDSLNKLDEGSNSAVEGSQKLVDGVDKFKNEIDSGIVDTKDSLTKLNGLSNYVENPVEIKEEAYGTVSSYGVAFTPLFISIGLWVGALMCYVVLYYDQRHRFGKLDYNEKNKILQNALYLVIGVVDGILTGLVLKAALGFEVVNMGVYIVECGIIGFVFMTIIQFLIRNLGDIGKFLALIILVLQLSASGGTFPVETIDKGFRFLNPLLPMTYTINILKECLIETNTHLMGRNTLILLGIAIALAMLTTTVELVKMKKAKKQ